MEHRYPKFQEEKPHQMTGAEFLGSLALVAAFGLGILLILSLSGFTVRQWTQQQVDVHAIAEQARAAGLSEDSVIIQECQRLWWDDYENMEIIEYDDGSDEARADPCAATAETDEEDREDPPSVIPIEQDIWVEAGISYLEYCTMCNTVEHEAGDGCTLEHKIAVAKVIWNRRNRDDFPNDIISVVTQPRQYSSNYVVDGLYGISDDTITAVNTVLGGGDNMPDDIIWQANFAQGSTWKTYYVDTGWFRSTTYIGRG